MTMKKKLAFLSAILMSCCIYTGCGSTDERSGTGNSNSATESSTYEILEKSSEAEPEESSESEPEEINKVLYEDATVRITYIGLDTEYWLGDGLKVTIENLSDKNITVQTREASVNGVMESPYFSCDVAAGKIANDSITFSTDDELGVVELSFHIYDSDTYSTIVDTNTITITVNEDVTVEKAEATVIYEANGVAVSYAGMEVDEIWGTKFNFIIENNGSETYTVHADNISIDGIMHDSGFIYAEVAAGKYANESMTFIGDENIPEEMNELEFTIRITDSNYNTIAESEPITVVLN